MILNVSGRTDIVAFYSKWFIKRYEEGFVDVRNLFNPNLVSRISFADVDLIVFCTKNPLPLLEYLPKIKKPILFHITLTPYNKDIEPNVPDKKILITAIKKVSQIVGVDNLYIRYDPIFLNDEYNLDYHKRAFSKMCQLLNGYVKHIIISFIDEYKNVKRNSNILKYRNLREKDYQEIGTFFSKIAQANGMTIQTCCEDHNLMEYGFIKGKCLSLEQAFKLTGKIYPVWKERDCGCATMVDIGVYNSCKHLCKYCYANYDENEVERNYLKHNPNSSLLIGDLKIDDIIKERHK